MTSRATARSAAREPRDRVHAWARRSGAAGVLSLLAAALVTLAPAPASAGVCALAGDGTADSPYLVTSAEDLALVGAGDCALSAS